MVPTTWLAVVSLAGAAVAQYFPPSPKGLKVVNSKHEKGVKISYKEVSSHLFFVQVVGCRSGTNMYLTPITAGDLRDHARRQVVLGLRTLASRNPERCGCIPKVSHQHVLLVLRGTA